jgi:hypothetical protein
VLLLELEQILGPGNKEQEEREANLEGGRNLDGYQDALSLEE